MGSFICEELEGPALLVTEGGTSFKGGDLARATLRHPQKEASRGRGGVQALEDRRPSPRRPAPRAQVTGAEDRIPLNPPPAVTPAGVTLPEPSGPSLPGPVLPSIEQPTALGVLVGNRRGATLSVTGCVSPHARLQRVV